MSEPPFNWRKYLRVHPAAEKLPMMNEAELQELGEDINANGLRVSIVIWRDPAPPPGALPCLLDGRNRLDAMAHGGLLTVNKEGHLCRRVDDGTEQVLRLIKYNEREGDPYKLVASFNVYRRHLSAEWKRQLIAEVLRVDPAKSNRAIARELKEDLNVGGCGVIWYCTVSALRDGRSGASILIIRFPGITNSTDSARGCPSTASVTLKLSFARWSSLKKPASRL